MKITCLGAGNRGYGYLRWMKSVCKDMELIAVSDLNKLRADNTARRFKAQKVFYSADELFSFEKFSDAIIIATQDNDHYGHCMQAIDAGYKYILVEKPVSKDISECEKLLKYSEEKGAIIVVCHVLRYHPYYKKLKELIDGGSIGDLVNINHSENIGYFHFAHSYVRGNWRREDQTSPMIFAKCCHDFDLFYWMVGKKFESVSSYGSLKFFTPENAPKDSAERCIDCKVKNCPYNAEKLYISDPLYKATFIRFMGNIITGKPKSTKADRYNALKTNNYGKCVFKCDNNVADHQVVNILFEDGITVSHTASAFSKQCFRRTQICGTLGEIVCDDRKGVITLKPFRGKTQKFKPSKLTLFGHVSGDIGIVRDFCKLVKGECLDNANITYLKETIASHRATIAAEKSRLNGGEVISL